MSTTVMDRLNFTKSITCLVLNGFTNAGVTFGMKIVSVLVFVD